MQRSAFSGVRLAVCAVVLLTNAAAQTATTNTSLYSSTTYLNSSQVYDVTGLTSGNQKFAVLCRGVNGLDIVNVTSPTTVVVAHLDPLPISTQIQDAAVGGNVLYVVQASGAIRPFDITNPAAPIALPTFGGSAENCFYDNGHLYVARGIFGGGGSFEIWNVAATPPALVFTYDNGAAFLCKDVTVGDGRAYVMNQVSTTNFSTLIFDVGQPSAAVQIGVIPGGGQSGAVFTPTGGAARILVCTTPGNSGVYQAWDVTAFATPVLLSAYQSATSTAARNVRVAGGRYAVIANYLDGLRIIDLANPADAVLVGTYDPFPTNVGLPVASGFYGVYAESGSRIYCSETVTQSGVSQGVYVVDFTPPSPLNLTLTTTGAGDFTLSVAGGPPGSNLFNLVSYQVIQPFGTGSVVGLGSDALQFFYSFQFPPFLDVFNPSGGYFLYLPPGSLFAGLELQFRALAYNPLNFQLSNLGGIRF